MSPDRSKSTRTEEETHPVGKATGLVHDLNNLLGIIRINLEVLEREVADAELRVLIRDAQNAADHCDRQIKELFAERMGEASPLNVIDLNEELSAIGNLVRAISGPRIQVEQELGNELAAVSADPVLFRRACLNLVVNARDAMAAAGRLFITTSNVEVDTIISKRIGVPPGAYVVSSFRDTGYGIAAETAERLFEPYFTTKSRPESTGLGLTLVREFCEHFGGFVQVDSEIGKGTTVSMYLPRIKGR